MRPVSYHAEDLISLLRQRKIATMDELKAALGTGADATVFRKLAEVQTSGHPGCDQEFSGWKFIGADCHHLRASLRYRPVGARPNR